ncbi:mechanosensitive ion channel family protein [Teredinibacter turnerae]|uniref:mechanosensitive ion channel family protein n=1 Tax=Teredinibacter turnerae TaxID=2426 RepID=UPI000380A723|nr:mechanosensitive ion channel domain-containing protein [Teredinibacter turnerae]
MKLLIIIALTIAMVFTTRLVRDWMIRLGQKKSVDAYRVSYITKTLNFAILIVFVMIIVSFLGLQYSQVTIFLSSIFAVLGVALFAQWSILSNITASLIIFFSFPYRVGEHIKVVDKDDDISGTVEGIALFHVIIRRGDDLITYPNTLILQKAVIKKSDTSVPAPAAPLDEN